MEDVDGPPFRPVFSPVNSRDGEEGMMVTYHSLVFGKGGGRGGGRRRQVFPKFGQERMVFFSPSLILAFLSHPSVLPSVPVIHRIKYQKIGELAKLCWREHPWTRPSITAVRTELQRIAGS